MTMHDSRVKRQDNVENFRDWKIFVSISLCELLLITKYLIIHFYFGKITLLITHYCSNWLIHYFLACHQRQCLWNVFLIAILNCKRICSLKLHKISFFLITWNTYMYCLLVMSIRALCDCYINLHLHYIYKSTFTKWFAVNVCACLMLMILLVNTYCSCLVIFLVDDILVSTHTHTPV